MFYLIFMEEKRAVVYCHIENIIISNAYRKGCKLSEKGKRVDISNEFICIS